MAWPLPSTFKSRFHPWADKRAWPERGRCPAAAALVGGSYGGWGGGWEKGGKGEDRGVSREVPEQTPSLPTPEPNLHPTHTHTLMPSPLSNLAMPSTHFVIPRAHFLFFSNFLFVLCESCIVHFNSISLPSPHVCTPPLHPSPNQSKNTLLVEGEKSKTNKQKRQYVHKRGVEL